jgi:osmotically-inducible protein OsmY
MPADEKIKADVVDQMHWDSRIDASDVAVKVDRGRVRLEGSVPTNRAKWAAADDAWLVAGVTSVENDLGIEYPIPARVPADTRIRDSVLGALDSSPVLADYDIDVTVSRGWITLEGSVEAFWEKVQAENQVLDLWGVIGVTNKLTVVPTENVADEAIAEDVVGALDRNANVSVDDVDVTVRNGIVTLNGTVPSRIAKSAAYNSALYTEGVTDVDNKLIVTFGP